MVIRSKTITKRERDCLVFIRDRLGNDFPVRLHELATYLKIKPPTALAVTKRLKNKGMVESRDGMIILTQKGNEASECILLVHRTFESLFFQSGISKEDACQEAGEIDFLIPEENAKRVLNRIDNPPSCPHGRPIIIR